MLRLKRTRLTVLCCLSALVWAVSATGQESPEAEPSPLDNLPQGLAVHRDVAYGQGPAAQWQNLDILYHTFVSMRRPAIVFIHGGGWYKGDKTRDIFQELMVEYANKGYVTLSINYRLSNVAPFPAAVEDCRLAIRWLRAHAAEYGVDPERIAALGSSAGGYLTYMVALPDASDGLEGDGPYQDQSSRVQAAVPISAPSDFRAESFPADYDVSPDSPWCRFLGGTPQEKPDAATKASPLSYVSKDDPPMLMVHFSGDPTVRVYHALTMDKALNEAGVEHGLTIIEAEGHGMKKIYASEGIPSRISAFLAKHLKTAK